MAPQAAIASAAPARPRSLRSLMADRDIPSFAELARRSGVNHMRITLIQQGWTGTAFVLVRLAKALGVTEADIIAAASLAHQGGAS